MASGGEGGPAGGDLGIQSGLNQVQVPCQSYERVWTGAQQATMGRNGPEQAAMEGNGMERNSIQT